MESIINIGQIGCGYWGPNLLRNLHVNSRCKVSLVVDRSKMRINFVQKNYPGIKVSQDENDIFNDPNIDAVVIATPVFSHFELVLKSIASQKHVLVEKPLAKNLIEIDKIKEAASGNNCIVMVGHTFLYNQAVRYIKNIIDSGHIGDVRYITSQRLNLGRIRSDIDALLNFAPHDVSIIQYLLNEPTPVSTTRHGMSYIQDDIDDVVFLNIKYPENKMANIHVSWLDPRRIRCMTIVGSEKMIVYDDISENKVTIFDKGINRNAVLGEYMDYDSNFKEFNYRFGDIVLPKIDFIEPLKVEIDHFFDCITKDIKCITGIDHARKVASILDCT